MKLTSSPSGRGIGAIALEEVLAPPMTKKRVSLSSPPPADGVFKRLTIKERDQDTANKEKFITEVVGIGEVIMEFLDKYDSVEQIGF